MVCGEASLGSQGTSSDRQQRVHRGYDDSDHCSPRQMGLPTLLDTECYPTVGYRGPEVRQASLQSCFGQSLSFSVLFCRRGTQYKLPHLWGAIRLRQAHGLSLDGKTKLSWSCELSVPRVIAPGALGPACLGSAGHSSLCLLPIFPTHRGGLAAPSLQTLPVWRSWDTLQASQCQPLPEKVIIWRWGF